MVALADNVPSDPLFVELHRLTAKQARFAELRAAGRGYQEAALEAGYAKSSAHAVATRLSKKPEVRKYIQHLLKPEGTPMAWKREDLVTWLVQVIATPAGEIGPDHPLCQSVSYSKHGRNIRIPDKLGAAQLLARITGWLDHEQNLTVDVTVQAREQLRAIRRGEDPNETIIDAEVSGA